MAVGSFTDGDLPTYTSEDIRFTTRTDVTGEYLYAILLARPDDGVARINAFGSGTGLLPRAVRSVAVLGDPEPVSWTRTSRSVEVVLSDSNADSCGVVVRIWLEPVVRPPRGDFLHG